MSTNNAIWPPQYTVKRHHLARYVRLKACLRRGLVFIIPQRFNIKNIPALIEQHRHWIEKELAQLATQRNQLHIENLPDSINLQAINQNWDVKYINSFNHNKVTMLSTEILLQGNIDDKINCKKKLILWIKNQAKACLPPLLETISQETGLDYKKVAIRHQNTRWGSCSTKQSINLNYKLLFLPTNLVRHVMIHELCHTIHFNHSNHFWTLFAQHDSDWQVHRRALRQAGQFVPAWLSSYDSTF